ncbi:MAG: hypothetical protein AAF804_18400, partial [Bacteroidota bacterium]
VDNPQVQSLQESVTFTLRNNGLKSLPLIIPGVMNPNLSPMSNSGVELKVGQKILFKYDGRRRLLLTVTPDLEGQVVDASGLYKQRIKEIQAEKK